MIITNERIKTAFGGEGEESFANAYKAMIKDFLSLPSSLKPLISHALAMYIARKYLNNTGTHEVKEDKVRWYAETTCIHISNYGIEGSTYILDTTTIANLSYQYAVWFNMITYHEYVADPLAVKAKAELGINVFPYVNFDLDQVMSVEILAMISNNTKTFADLQLSICCGMKYINKRILTEGALS